jgi:hypothetical protein
MRAAILALLLVAPVSACAGQSQPPPGEAAAVHHHSFAPALPLRAGERLLDLTVAQPYRPVPPNGGTDEYRCMLLDPKLTKAAYLTGSQFQPQNVPIAHHALVFVVPPTGAAEARARDAADPGEGYTCFGDAGLTESTWADTWTPGVRETLLDEDAGYVVKPGSLVVVQVHYNLLAIGGRADQSDQSGVRLRLTDGTAATVPLDTMRLLAPIELPCAAGESGPLCDRGAAIADVKKRFGEDSGGTQERLVKRCWTAPPKPGVTQHCDTEVPAPATVYAARGHMHMLGRAIKIELNPGTPSAATLLDVPAFDFDDQALHVLPEPVSLKRGDKLRVTCTHDAALRRQVPQLKTLPARYVVWGDGTSDEMCLGLLTASAG